MQVNNRQILYKQYSNYNNTSFCGHAGSEIFVKLGKKHHLTTETAFFRDYPTLKFAVDYINNVFPFVKTKHFVIGACSSGEEAQSFKMLMKDKPVNIIGFDIAKEALSKANKGFYEIARPYNKAAEKYVDSLGMDAYKDSYLAFEQDVTSTEKEYLKNLFDNMFESVNKKEKLIYGLSEALRKIFDVSYIEFDKKYFKLKNEFADCCKFVYGDIKNLDNILPKEKIQLFSFRNAFYHIITDNNICTRQKLPEKYLTPILDNIFKTINKSMDKRGLFLLGSEEDKQQGDIHLVTKFLLKNGFAPIRFQNRTYSNIWTKIHELENYK